MVSDAQKPAAAWLRRYARTMTWVDNGSARTNSLCQCLKAATIAVPRSDRQEDGPLRPIAGLIG